jgi:hypothetical protein
MRRHAILTLTAVLALSGCSATAAPDSLATTPEVSASATPTASPAPATTPSAAPPSAAPPDAAVASCDTILTDDEYAALAADGLTLDPDIRAFDDTMQSLMDDGFGCYWTRGGGDVRVWYAQAAQDDGTWAAQKQGLLDSGWAQTDDPVPGVLQAGPDHDPNYSPAVVHQEGVTHYASYAGYFTSVTALLG